MNPENCWDFFHFYQKTVRSQRNHSGQLIDTQYHFFRFCSGSGYIKCNIFMTQSTATQQGDEKGNGSVDLVERMKGGK